MTVTFRRKQVSPTVEILPNLGIDKTKRVQTVVEQVSSVNAVDNLRRIIERQQRRVDKLAQFESLVPYTLDQLTSETRLLKDMYNDVIKFQTSAAVLKHMQQELEHRGISGAALEFNDDISSLQSMQDATKKAVELLRLMHGEESI